MKERKWSTDTRTDSKRKKIHCQHQCRWMVQQTTGSKKEGFGREYMWNQGQSSTPQHLKTTDQTSTDYSHTEQHTYQKRQQEWTGFTNFEERREYREEMPTEEEDEQQSASKAKAMMQPVQPTPQEIQQHNLTRMPYRSWCPVCVQSRGRQTSHQQQTPRQPIIQVDFTYIKTYEDKWPVPILTAIEIQTCMAMATMLTDKKGQFAYAQTSLQAFILECGRAEGILQSDQEEYLMALRSLELQPKQQATWQCVLHQHTAHKAAAASKDSMHTGWPHQDTQGTGTAELQHKTANNTSNYRHSAYLINRFLICSDGYTSYHKRWGRTQCSSLRIWRDCGTVHQTKAKTRAQVLQRHRRQTCTFTYSQATCRSNW